MTLPSGMETVGTENGYLIVRTVALWMSGFNVYRQDPDDRALAQKVNPYMSWFNTDAAARAFARGQPPA